MTVLPVGHLPHSPVARAAAKALVLSATTLAVLAFGPLVTGAPAQERLVPFGGTFNNPVYATAPPGDSRRLFVVERGGTIQVVRDGVKLGQPYLTIPGGVSTDGERGLLSMAFDPGYAQNRRFYVFYTTPTAGNPNGGDLRIDEFRRSTTSINRADPSSRRRILTIEHSSRANHNGGQLQFGPDGLLYISTGDGGGANDPAGNAQNIDSLLGKLLRIIPRANGGSPYRVPTTNPFVGRVGRDEIWAYGLRNPFRFSFDRQTGDLSIGDVGQNTAEEIDFRARGASGVANFGWVCYEGFERTPGVPPCDPPSYVPPVLDYGHPTNGCSSITGGYVVRDSTLESLVGRYVYGDYCSGQLRSTLLRPGGAVDDRPLSVKLAPFSLASFGEDALGRLYVVSLTEGRIFRLAD